MPRTAEVIYVGDAASLLAANEKALSSTRATQAGIEASGGKLRTSLTSVSGAGKKAASELEHSTGRMGTALGGIASSGNLAVAGIVAVGAAVEGIKKSADTLEELGKTTLKLHNLTGLNVETASAYASVAKVQDIPVKGLTMSFIALSKNAQMVVNAQNGLTKGAKTQENAFKLLGLPVRDVVAAHGNLNKLLPEVVSKFEALPGSINKAAIAQALFGRGAQALVPLMHKGALGLKENLDEAKMFGAVLGIHTAAQMKKFTKAQEEGEYASLGLQVAIGQHVAPELTKLISTMARVVGSIRSGSGQIGQAAHAIGQVFGVIAPIVGPILGTFVGMIKGSFKSIEGLVHILAGVLTLNFGEAWEGVKQVFQGGVNAVVSIFSHLPGSIKSILGDVVSTVEGVFNSLYNAGKYIIDGLVKGIMAGASAVTGAVSDLAHEVVSIPSKIWKAKSPSKVFETLGMSIVEGLSGGLLSGKEIVAAGLDQGLIFPVDAAIAALQGKLKAIEAASTRASTAAERAGLVGALNAARNAPITTTGAGHVVGTGGTTFTPHGGSTGFFAGSGTNYSKGQEPALAAALDRMGKALGIKLTGISGYRTPAHSVAVGGFANDPHTRGQASDTEGTQRIAEKVLERFGLTRPFPGAKEANHIQLLAGATAAAVHAVVHSAGGQKLTGKISWFGGPNDAMSGPTTASGAPVSQPGISTYNKGTLGGYWRVKLPNGKTAVLKQTDIGPAPWTGKKFDFTSSSLKGLGYSEKNFPTGATITGEYLGKHPSGAGRSVTTSAKGAENHASAIKKATEALKQFDAKARETSKLAKINIQIEHLEKLKAWEEAISGLRAKMKELAQQAGQAWRAVQQGAIEHGANAQALASKHAEDEAESLRQTNESNTEALEAAKKHVKEARDNENPEELKEAEKEQRHAEEAITATARQQDEKRAEEAENVELDSLDARTTAYEAALETQLGALTGNLEKGLVKYAEYAGAVNAILPGLYAPDAATQAALAGVPAGTGGVVPYETAKVRVGMPPKPQRASGGLVYPGVSYTVGEVGPETFTPKVSGNITAAGQSGAASMAGGAHIHVAGDMIVSSRRDAQNMAHSLAHKLAFGGR